MTKVQEQCTAMMRSAAFWAAVRERMSINGKDQPKRLAFPENLGGRKPRNVSPDSKSIRIPTLRVKREAT
jgi:hypothetical protein